MASNSQCPNILNLSKVVTLFFADLMALNYYSLLLNAKIRHRKSIDRTRKDYLFEEVCRYMRSPASSFFEIEISYSEYPFTDARVFDFDLIKQNSNTTVN